MRSLLQIPKRPRLFHSSFHTLTYLRTSLDLCTHAITRSANNEMIMMVAPKEVTLGHIREYFRMRTALGMYERLGATPVGGAGGGPANIVNAGNGEAARH